MMKAPEAFRQGDVRGIYPDDIDEVFVAEFAHAFVGYFNLHGKVATGRDMRVSSQSLQTSLNDALVSAGIEVVDLGLCATELGYFASVMPDIEAAIVVTASHNPGDYNGLKCVLHNGQAITSDTGLAEIARLMTEGYRHAAGHGSVTLNGYRDEYLRYLKHHFPADSLHLGKVALNGLNGTASTMADSIVAGYGLPVTWFRKEPGPIPEEGADPSSPGMLQQMKTFMSTDDFVLGVAWDGDSDRCVCFDHQGDLIPTYYLIGLLIEAHLKTSPGRAIVFDTKLCWNTIEIIDRFEGIAVPSRTGHAFMKQRMHQYNAIYGGELSSHHYYGAFYGCDSGMFTWLTVLKLLKETRVPIRELVATRKLKVVTTPEITVSLTDAARAIESIRRQVQGKALSTDEFDGFSACMPGDWRFSVTPSKTQPVVRINFEARGSGAAILEEGRKLFDLLEPFRTDEHDWLEQFRLQ